MLLIALDTEEDHSWYQPFWGGMENGLHGEKLEADWKKENEGKAY